MVEVNLALSGYPWAESVNDLAADASLAAVAGVRMVRVDAYWNMIETADGVHDWDQADVIFDAFSAVQIKVLWIVNQSPSWARTGGTVHSFPDDSADYADFCTALVGRYKNRGIGCDAYQIWNEPGSPSGATNPNDVAAYYDLLVAGYDAIKAADSSATVVLGPLLGGGGYDSPREVWWLDKLYSLGGGDYFDAMAVHTYCRGQDPANTTPTAVPSGSNHLSNGGFDADIAGWTVSNGSGSWSASGGIDGGGALQVTADAGGVANAYTGAFPAAGDAGYLIRASVKTSDGMRLFLLADYYDSGYGYLSSSQSDYITVNGLGYVELAIYVASDPDTSYLSVRVETELTPSNGDVFLVDSASFYECSWGTYITDLGYQLHGWNRLGDIRSVMSDHGDSAKPIWITEFGQYTGTAGGSVSETVQATYLTHAHTRAKAEDQVTKWFWFNHRNTGTTASVADQNFGLVQNNYTEKTAYDVFAALAQAENGGSALPLLGVG